MSTVGLADLLGVSGKTIRWERPFLFLAALFVGDLFFLLVAPSVSHSDSSGYSYEFFHFAGSFDWLTAFVGDVILGGVALAAFRWISKTWLAVPAASIAYVVLDRPALYVLYKLLRSEEFSSYEWLFAPQSFLLSMLWVILIFTGIALALRWMRHTWLALMTGALAGTLLHRILAFLIQQLSGRGELITSLFFLPFGLLSMAVFALVFYGLLRLTSGPSLGQGEGEQHISRGFFLGTIAVADGLPLLIFEVGTLLLTLEVWERRDAVPALLLYLLASLMATYGIVVFSVLIYRMWAAIQDGHARTTPGRAVGLLFVPFFNFYWGFQTFAGFAADYNAYVERHSLNVPRLAPGLFVAYMVLCLLSVVPVVMWGTAPITFIVGLFMVSKICRAVCAIPHAVVEPAR